MAVIAIVALVLAITAHNKDSTSEPPTGPSLGVQTTSDACSSAPCLNGARCFNMDPDDYICLCAGHFYGRQCQLVRESTGTCTFCNMPGGVLNHLDDTSVMGPVWLEHALRNQPIDKRIRISEQSASTS